MVSSEYVVVVFFPPPRGRASPAPRVNEEGCNPSCSHRVKSGSRCQMCWGQSGGRAAEEIPTPTADRSSVHPLAARRLRAKHPSPSTDRAAGAPAGKRLRGTGRAGGASPPTPHTALTHIETLPPVPELAEEILNPPPEPHGYPHSTKSCTPTLGHPPETPLKLLHPLHPIHPGTPPPLQSPCSLQRQPPEILLHRTETLRRSRSPTPEIHSDSSSNPTALPPPPPEPHSERAASGAALVSCT